MKFIRKFNEELKDIKRKIDIKNNNFDIYQIKYNKVSNIINELKFILHDNYLKLIIHPAPNHNYLSLNFIMHKFPIKDEYLESIEEFLNRLMEALPNYKLEKTKSTFMYRIGFPK